MTKNKSAEELAIERVKHIREYISGYCVITHPKARQDGISPEDYILAYLDDIIALLAAEQRAQQGWRTDMENAPKGVPVLVPGGLAMRKTGDEWFTGMEEPLYQRPIQWTVTHWMPLPSAPNTPNTVTTSTDAIAYVKTRLAQIASGDYKACGHTAEEVAADALKAIEAEIGGVS